MKKRFLSTGILFMVLVGLLAAIGIGYAQWSAMLTINGTVNTGNVDAAFVGDACTDDDGVVTCPNDLGTGLPKDADDDGLDPAASGVDPKARYDKDVALCTASIIDPLTAQITKSNVYPDYYCTAWFDVLNSGTIPVKVAAATVTPGSGGPAVTLVPCTPEPVDLDGDGDADVMLHLTGIDGMCQQIHDGETVQIDIDQQILPGAPTGANLSYTVELLLQAYNQPCP